MVETGPGQVLVTADPDGLERVLRHLLRNALAYTPAGGAVRLRVAAEDGTARVTVQDGGIGIPAAALPHIFERFYRVADPRVQALPGWGLGLYLCQRLTALHGGQLAVESEPEEGSAFTLTLPTESPDGQHPR